jgi:hypothetical protein
MLQAIHALMARSVPEIIKRLNRNSAKKQEVRTEEKNVEESRSANVFQKRSCEVIPDNTGM